MEHVHENASIAYSPASTAQFNALAQLAANGLIHVNGTSVDSIPVPSSVPIPFRDYLGSLRIDWAESSKSQWFLRTSADSYLTRNALVQQATLPSTGLTTHNNYFNTVISNTHTFSPSWLGTFIFDASELHLTQTRNSTLGFALQFPFSLTSLTVSGFETFGANQFATPITAFPEVRNQEKYQFRYDLSRADRRSLTEIRNQLYPRASAEWDAAGNCGDAGHLPERSNVLHGKPRQSRAISSRSSCGCSQHSCAAMAASRKIFSGWRCMLRILFAYRSTLPSTTDCDIKLRLDFSRPPDEARRQILSSLCSPSMACPLLFRMMTENNLRLASELSTPPGAVREQCCALVSGCFTTTWHRLDG